MKQYIRSLGYRDRLDNSYKTRICIGVLLFCLWFLPGLIENIRDYANYSAYLGDSPDVESGFAFFAVFDMNLRLDDIFTALGITLPCVTMLAGICMYYSTVVSQGKFSGWNRYLRTLPVTVDMRAKAMLWSRSIIFLFCTLGVSAVSTAIAWITIGRGFALKVLFAALLTSLLVESCDMLVDAFVTRWILRYDRKTAIAISLEGGIGSLLRAYTVGWFSPGQLSWEGYADGVPKSIQWIFIFAVLIAINVGGYKLLKVNLKRQYE